jgi:hypothetical protein
LPSSTGFRAVCAWPSLAGRQWSYELFKAM